MIMGDQKKDRGWAEYDIKRSKIKVNTGLKPKDLMLIPARVALALQGDGWYLRSDVIWHKPNPMPESVTDRPTKAHEYVFLMSKGERYYYDATAIAEEGSIESMKRMQRGVGDNHKNVNGAPGQTPHSMNRPRPHAARGANFTSFSGSTLGPKVSTTLYTDNGSFDAWGWLDLGQSQVCVSDTVTLEAQCFKVIELIGFKIRVKAPEGDFVVNLQTPPNLPAMLASEVISLLRQSSLGGPIQPAILNASASPSGAILAGHINGEPFPGTLVGAKVVGLKCALVSGEFFSAVITLNCNEVDFTLFVWGTLGSAHCNVSFFPEGHNNIIPETPQKRNRRSVWTVATQPFSGAHFAVFPAKLIEPMILASTSEVGVCGACGGPWVRVVERVKGENGSYNGSSFHKGKSKEAREHLSIVGEQERTAATVTTGWRPSCACADAPTVPAVVLDPFAGSGTTLEVTIANRRKGIGIDANPTYATELAAERLNGTQITMGVF